MKLYALVQCGIQSRLIIGMFSSVDQARDLFNWMYDLCKQDIPEGWNGFDGWHNYVIREIKVGEIYPSDGHYTDVEDLEYEPLRRVK